MKLKQMCLLSIAAMMAVGSGCSNEQQKSNETIKWLVPERTMDAESQEHPANEKGLNKWLEQEGKNYSVEFVTYADESSWDDIKKIAEEENADIVNVSNPWGYRNSPQSYIMQAVTDDFCLEIDEEYPESEKLKYNGKLYGYGNVEIQSISGVSYSERYIELSGSDVEDLTSVFTESEESEKFLKDHKNFVSMIGSPTNLSRLNVVGDIFYIDQFTGECGYLYDNPKLKEKLDYKSNLIRKGYMSGPGVFSSVKSEEPDVSGNGGWLFEKYDELTTNHLTGTKEVFKPDSYDYVLNNVQLIENVIWKNSTHSKSAKDFLHELYSNRSLCNYLIYEEEEPEFPETGSIEEYIKLLPGNTTVLCNENLVDQVGGWTTDKKKAAYKEYCEQWKDSKVEGFQFTLPEELKETYEAVQETMYIGNGTYGEYGELVNGPSRWEKIWSSLKEKVEAAGGSEIIAELQKQVDAYIRCQ